MPPSFVKTKTRPIHGTNNGEPIILDYTGHNLLIWTEANRDMEYRSIDPENDDVGDWIQPGSSRMFVSEVEIRVRIEVRLVNPNLSDVLDIEHDEGT